MNSLLRRDLRLATRAGGGFGLGLVFFLIVVVLVPFGVGPQTTILSQIAAGILWVAALLAALLSLDRIFALDQEDGALALLATAPIPLEMVGVAKAIAHWLTTGLPLSIAAPVLGVLLQLQPSAYVFVAATLLLGTPALSMIGTFGAALTVGIRRGGLLLSLLVLPLYVPTLIFGAEAVRRGAQGLDATTPLLMLGGITAGSFALLPFDDYRQGSTVKIIYLHVPSAFMAINTWIMMLVGSLIWLVRRQHVSALAAKAAAPIGLTMTLIALLTGAIWGQPMWGTYWAWDPRLTSFLILFLFYLGYMALWAAIDDPDTAADLTSVLCIVGSVFAVLSRYAVKFWNQGLHQGTSVPLATGERTVSDIFFVPLAISSVGFILLFIALVLLRTRTEIRSRRLRALQLRESRR